MIYEQWLDSAASAMGVTTEQAGIMLSLLFIIILSFSLTILSKGKYAATVMLGSSLIGFITFIFFGWFPLWTGSLIALIIGLLLAKTVSGGL